MRDLIILLAVIIVLAAALLWALRLLTKAPLNPAIRNLLIGLGLVEAALFLLHTTTWDSAQITGFADWFFDLDREFNLGSTFASAQFVLISLAALMCASVARRVPRLYWLILSAAFAFLAADEYFIIHEQIFERFNLPGEWWRYLYAGGGGALVLLSAYVYWRWLRTETRTFTLLFAGVVIMGLSGVALERLIWNVRCPDVNACFEPLLIIEEIFELIGQTIMLAGLLVYAHKHAANWPRVRRLHLLGGAAWALLLVLYQWAWPPLEARTLAQPASVAYLDGALELIGYQVSSEVVQPDGELAISLFWRANEPLLENYNQSVRLFSKPDAAQVTQFDLEALDVRHIPSSAWLPGAVYRSRIELPVPADLTTPASYWLGVRLWYGDWQDTRGLDISTTPNQLLTPDVVLLSSVAAPGQPVITPLETEAHYSFADGFTLTGYTLPQSAAPGDSFAPAFAWQTDRAVDRPLTQFVHFINAAGEFVFGHDQPPFAGRFPTDDWPAGMQVQDAWSFDIPDDVPPGEYRMFTGLYDADIQRAPVTDASGQPVPDHTIELGTVRIE